jgi:hypothetical protein
VYYCVWRRIDVETTGLKAKAVIEAIEKCLRSKEDYTGEIIREALHILSEDEVPVYALMRTAILASQSYADVKRYVLTDMIPQMISKQVWTTAPKIWEGVVYVLKNFVVAGYKHCDQTLKSLLTLPGTQLKSILKVAANLKPLFAKYVQALPAEERDKWVGQEPDKAKLLKELMQLVVT